MLQNPAEERMEHENGDMLLSDAESTDQAADDDAGHEQLMPLAQAGSSDPDSPLIQNGVTDDDVKENGCASEVPVSQKRKVEELESDSTDVETEDEFDQLEEEDDAFNVIGTTVKCSVSSAAAATVPVTPVSIKSRRPSRSCKPNSLIFNSDTTTLSPKRRRPMSSSTTTPAVISKRSSGNKQSHTSSSSTTKTITTSGTAGVAAGSTGRNTSTRQSTREQQLHHQQKPLISSRSFARESVRKAVSALTGVNRPVKKLGRPRKFPAAGDPDELSDLTPTVRVPVSRKVKGRKVVRGKKLTVKKRSSPASPKCTPILTAILSGQSLAQTKTGRPKGRPRILPSLNEVILNGAKSTPSSTTRSSPRRCDCEAKYKQILSSLEQSLEVKFAESTHKVSLAARLMLQCF